MTFKRKDLIVLALIAALVVAVSLSGMSDMDASSGVIVGLILYIIPTVVALSRNHRNTLAIGALNLLLGWTFIGWVVALVWALTANVRESADR